MSDKQDLPVEHIRGFQSSLEPTSIQDWERSDKYHNSFLIPKDDVLDAAVRNSTEQGLPEIAVSSAQGKFLHLIAKSIGAKKILEVGTLGG
jgi:predicted O-methyltransferase YrrM